MTLPMLPSPMALRVRPAAAEPLREPQVRPRVVARPPRAWPQARRVAQAVPKAHRPPVVPAPEAAAAVAGSNWASLATAETPVPLTRPIKVECAANEFRILADGGRVESRIPIGTHTVDSVDLVVREVHATVGRWGLAGDRMYWKPELVLSSTPDGAGRREDLEKLLADSGIDTRRSEVKDKVRYLPPVQRTGSLFPRR